MDSPAGQPASDARHERYHLIRAGSEFGPFTGAELVELERNGRVAASDLIRPAGAPESRPWSEVRRHLVRADLPPILPPAPPMAPAQGRDTALEVLLPINQSFLAIAAGYAGIVGLFTLGLVGPIAILLGVLALRSLKPEQGGRSRAIVGIVLGAVGILLGGGLLVAIALSR